MALILSGFVGLASWQLDRPGWYYDEMLFVQAALPKSEMSTGAFLTWHGIPIKVFFYIGALKAWIYKPIFSVFGLSYYSMRLPAILLSAVTLAVTFFSVRRWLGITVALVITLLCAVNPSFIMQSRLDWGPVVLMWLCKATAMALLFRWLEKPSLLSWHLAGFLLVCALGFFDKYNFLWIILAYGLATLTIYFPECRRAVKSVPLWGLTVFGLLGIASGWLIRSIIAKMVRSPDLGHQRLSHIWKSYAQTNSGVDIGRFWFQDFSRPADWLGGAMIVMAAILLVIAGIQMLRRDRSLRKFFIAPELRLALWSLVVWSSIFIQMVLTPQAGGPHHAAATFPFDLFAVAALGKYLWQENVAQRQRWSAVFAVGAALWMASCGISLAAFYPRLARIGAHQGKFSPRMNDLAVYLGQIGNDYDRIVAVDWGMGKQLEAITPRPARWKCVDDWDVFQKWPAKVWGRRHALEEIFSADQRLLFILFRKKKSVFADCRRHFFEINKKRGNLVVRLPDVPSEVSEVYELYTVQRKSDGRAKP